jgi:2-hydroxychromene-2-carboxylate isomerase
VSARRCVDFFYCCSSPWDYLAFVRLKESAMRTQSEIACRPVLAQALRTSSAAAAAPSAAAARYADKDLQDWARFCGVSIVAPTQAAIDVEWAQRGAVAAAADSGPARAYTEAIFRACFTERRDIAHRSAVIDIAAECGLPRADFERSLDAESTLATLRANAEELLRRGGYATPTMFLGDDMYVGHERVPLLESALMRASDRPFVAPGEHDRI